MGRNAHFELKNLAESKRGNCVITYVYILKTVLTRFFAMGYFYVFVKGFAFAKLLVICSCGPTKSIFEDYFNFFSFFSFF